MGYISYFLTFIAILSPWILYKWNSVPKVIFRDFSIYIDNGFGITFYLKCKNKDIPNPLFNIKITNFDGKLIFQSDDMGLPILEISRKGILEKYIETSIKKSNFFLAPHQINSLEKKLKITIKIKSDEEEIVKKDILCQADNSHYNIIKISKKWYEYFDHIL